MELIKQHLKNVLPEINVEPFLEKFETITKIRKGDYLIKPNQNTQFLAFVNKGAFRVFYIDKKGKEISVLFAFQNMWVTDLLAFYKNERASYYVEALEDSEVYIISKNNLDNLYAQNNAYLYFAKHFAENGMITMLERSNHLFQEMTAEERYVYLMKTPILNQNIPLKYIATFIGITETSLSRIRRKLAKK
jgi:CRP-like cAMP-binding protein